MNDPVASLRIRGPSRTAVILWRRPTNRQINFRPIEPITEFVKAFRRCLTDVLTLLLRHSTRVGHNSLKQLESIATFSVAVVCRTLTQSRLCGLPSIHCKALPLLALVTAPDNHPSSVGIECAAVESVRSIIAGSLLSFLFLRNASRSCHQLL